MIKLIKQKIYANTIHKVQSFDLTDGIKYFIFPDTLEGSSCKHEMEDVYGDSGFKKGS